MEKQTIQCINCERTADQVPLVPILTRDAQVYICPQCLPILIHKPQQLADKLHGADALLPHKH